MALTRFQKEVCRLLASHRSADARSYVAGGAALNAVLSATRLSRDVDVFHDTLEALDETWRTDRQLLQENGYDFEIVRERSGFVEAVIRRNGESVEMQWVRHPILLFLKHSGTKR